jgi:hypothetical protein
VDGFLPAEKNLSESRMANGATRLQPHTLLMGQAVGAIAALAIERHVQPRQVDPVLVQSVLLDAHDTLFVTPISDVRQSSPNWQPIQLVLTRGLLQADGHQFHPDEVISSEAMAGLLRAIGASTAPTSSGTDVLKALSDAAEKGSHPFAFHASVPDPSKPLTRVEAARLASEFLRQRAGSVPETTRP